jgi:hypothetical protein
MGGAIFASFSARREGIRTGQIIIKSDLSNYFKAQT